MEGDRSRGYQRRWRNGPSLFFPVLLITVGIVWMLINYGQIPAGNVFRLIAYWPVLLVAAGLSVILKQISWVLSGLLWVGLGAVFVWFVMVPPVTMPGFTSPEFTHKEFSEPIGAAKSATIRLDASVFPVEVRSSSRQDELFSAKIDYVGGLDYEADGSGSQKTVHLGENITGSIFNLPAMSYESQGHTWEVGLTQRIPLKFDVRAGAGPIDLDLSALQLSSLKVDGSLGSMKIVLPEDSPSYTFQLNVSAGSAEVRVPSGATLDMKITGGTGSVDIVLPKDSGVQVTVRSDGMGSLNLPEEYQKVRQGENDKEGVWENEAYKRDESPIHINIDIGLGSITIE